MFSANGIGIIKNCKEKETTKGSWFNFSLITKDPYRENGRHVLKASCHVPKDYVEKAREIFQKGKGLQIRMGELHGIELKSGAIFMTINTKWKWVEPLKALPMPERKQYEDI